MTLDGVQFVAGCFRELRGVIDSYRHKGRTVGHFLLLGSASWDILRQSDESLARCVPYMKPGSLDLTKIEPEDKERLWSRGGFPESFLAKGETASAV